MSAAILLAAGASRRMGGANKLLLPVGGLAMVRRVALALVEGGLSPVVAVLGAEAAGVRTALAGLPVRFVVNERHEEGMGTSLACGVAHLEPGLESVAVAVGDLPGLRGSTVRRVAAAWAASDRGIAVPSFRGRQGHPVFFRLGRYRARLACLEGDRGARTLLAEHPEDVLVVPVDDPGAVTDVDTPEEYQRQESSA